MEPVCGGRAQGVDVARRDRGDEQRGAPHVERRVRERHRRGQLAPRLLGRRARGRHPHDDRRLETERHAHRTPTRDCDDPAVERRGDVVFVPFERGRLRQRLLGEAAHVGRRALLRERREHTRDARRAREAESPSHRDL